MSLDKQVITRIGEVLGEHLTEDQLGELCDVLAHAGQACDYAAEDLGERAHYERNHSGSDEERYNTAAEDYGNTGAAMAQLVMSIQTGEKGGR